MAGKQAASMMLPTVSPQLFGFPQRKITEKF
jgi:hypothetical protein